MEKIFEFNKYNLDKQDQEVKNLKESNKRKKQEIESVTASKKVKLFIKLSD